MFLFFTWVFCFSLSLSLSLDLSFLLAFVLYFLPRLLLLLLLLLFVLFISTCPFRHECKHFVVDNFFLVLLFFVSYFSHDRQEQTYADDGDAAQLTACNTNTPTHITHCTELKVRNKTIIVPRCFSFTMRCCCCNREEGMGFLHFFFFLFCLSAGITHRVIFATQASFVA